MTTTRSPRGRRTAKSGGSSARTSSKRKTQATERRRSRIPVFRSRQEEAEFWDTHSIADYQDELVRIRVRAAKLSEPITIRLDPITLAELREISASQGIGPTTLIRMWVLDRLRSGSRAPVATRGRKR